MNWSEVLGFVIYTLERTDPYSLTLAILLVEELQLLYPGWAFSGNAL